MPTPLYTVTVTSPTRSWSFTSVQGTQPDPEQDVHVGDGLTYAWAFADQQVPSPRTEPSRVSMTLSCRDATYVPEVIVGDQVTLTIRLGTTGPYIAAPPPMTVVNAEADITASRTTVTVGLVDSIADLPTKRPQPRNAFAIRVNQQLWRPRIAEVAAQIGISIGCPTWWADLAEPPGRSIGPDGDGATWESDAAQMLEALLNTHQPNGVTHTLVPCHTSGYPTASNGGAYRWVGPDATTYTEPDGDVVDVWRPGPAIADPGTTGKYLIVPAGRYAGAHSIATLDAAWCDLPVKARRSREHVVDSVNVGGYEIAFDAADSGVGGNTSLRKSTRTYGYAGPGAVTRQLAAYADLGDAADSTYWTGTSPSYASPAAEAIAARYLSDASTRAAWVYDQFTLHSSRIPDADQADVLPFLCPRYPGETDGDGHVLRRLELDGIYAAAALPGAGPVAGFVSAGQLRISGGDLLFDLSLTPGDTL